MTTPLREARLTKRRVQGSSNSRQNATDPPPARRNSPPNRPTRERNLTAESSVLDTIGAEIVGLMAPVSICMFVVVLVVYALPPPSTDVIKLVFVENPSDPASVKLRAAFLEALVFVVVLAASTFFMALLYYYNYVSASFFNRQQRFSAFAILGGTGGAIYLALVQYFSIPIDVLTFFVLWFNFTIVGVLSLCSRGIPIILRQGYMVVLGVIVAVWLTKLPEWTTWVLLVALAVYDLVAVLSPHGPIKLLVELAQSRNEEIPGLVYEAWPTVSESTGPQWWSGGVSDVYDISKIYESFDTARILENFDAARFNDLFAEFPLVASSAEIPPSRRYQLEYSTVVESEIVEDEDMPPLTDVQNSGNESIKLGLGDFVLYSVLVGRAAMYDSMTVYACYLGIISGLGCTLILLSVYPRALPALPISIGLGVIFYFSTRLLLEPFIIGTSTNLVFF